jgi:hypothetical protein
MLQAHYMHVHAFKTSGSCTWLPQKHVRGQSQWHVWIVPCADALPARPTPQCLSQMTTRTCTLSSSTRPTSYTPSGTIAQSPLECLHARSFVSTCPCKQSTVHSKRPSLQCAAAAAAAAVAAEHCSTHSSCLDPATHTMSPVAASSPAVSCVHPVCCVYPNHFKDPVYST